MLAEVHNPYVVKLLYSFQVSGLVQHVCTIYVLQMRSAAQSAAGWRQDVVGCRTSTIWPSALQDDEYLYLIMEYLPGGDVMVSCIPLASTVALPCLAEHVIARCLFDTDPSAAADAADAEGHPERGGDALLHCGDGAGAGVHPPPQLHPQVLFETAAMPWNHANAWLQPDTA